MQLSQTTSKVVKAQAYGVPLVTEDFVDEAIAQGKIPDPNLYDVGGASASVAGTATATASSTSSATASTSKPSVVWKCITDSGAADYSPANCAIIEAAWQKKQNQVFL